MITIFKENGKALVKEEHDTLEGVTLEPGSWIHLDNPTAEILNQVAKLTEINNDMLMATLDDEESARIDTDDGCTLIVLDTPYVEDVEKGIYTTAPFVIAYNRSYYVTASKHNFELMSELFKRVKLIEPHKHVRMTLNFVYRLATLFINYLKKIDVNTKDIEFKLRDSMKNKELFSLMDINKTLVYFSTALNADKGILSKLLRSQNYKKYGSDFDLMEDAEVEINQAIEMCSIYREILVGMMGAFGSVISNNLNIVMKTLAIVTIVISIPTLIASIYGMNVENLPLAHNPYGFYILLGVSIVCSLVGAICILFISNKSRKD